MVKEFSQLKQTIIAAPHQGNHTVFLEGPAGSGKTSLAIERVRHLVRNDVTAGEILIFVPQHTLGIAYEEGLKLSPCRREDQRGDEMPAGTPVELVTLGGLIRRHVELFWPLIARPAGFTDPGLSPTFLNLETAQYYMQRVTGLTLDTRGFEGITISRGRLASQLIDNLNKSALAGFPADDISERLKGAWAGESSHLRVFDQAQERAMDFRRYCLQHNLLDFSLQLDVFTKFLVPLPAFKNYLFQKYRHLIIDNVEENPPVTHDLLKEWLPQCHSALIVYDSDGGYRAFLGADPANALSLKDVCRDSFTLSETYIMSPGVDALRVHLSQALGQSHDSIEANAREAFSVMPSTDPADVVPRFQTQMLEKVGEEISHLVNGEGVPPNEIVVLAPFLSDALRFTLANRLRQHGLQTRSHRPSRALREEPATRCLLTLAALAYPHWKMTPGKDDFAQAMMQTFAGLDLVRANLLTQIVYRPRDGQPTLTSFDQIGTEAQERLTYSLGERYDELRGWLDQYREKSMGAELDHFFSLIFDEVLSHKGFGFHQDLDAAGQTANLIESVRRFRQVVTEGELPEGQSVGREYVEMVQQGVLAAQYEWGWRIQPEEAILIAPAYTFLMYNKPVDYQFWVNVSSSGWWERIYQPLTHPYVLSRHWATGTLWKDADEFEARQTALRRLILGLVRRCRKHIYLGISRLNEQGYEETGPLLQIFNRVNRSLYAESGASHA